MPLLRIWAGIVLASCCAQLAAFLPPRAARADEPLLAGFAAVDITPDLQGGRRMYMAGYGLNRKATGVHDRLFARTVVLSAGSERIAICGVDLVGLQYPQVKAIRARLADFRYVLVASTHNHEGPDVIGIWGRGPFHRGVDDAYLDQTIEGVVESVRQAAARLAPVTAAYGTAEDETLLADNRLPIVKDGVLRIVRLNAAASDTAASDKTATAKPAGLIVQWNCHPESLGPRNTLLTADFPSATVAELEKQYGCPVVYLTGAVGGLMTNPTGRILDDAGKELPDGTFDYARRYGEEVARLAQRAINRAEPTRLTPWKVAAKTIAVPVQNSLYRAARSLGVLKRDGLIWTGDFQTLGAPMSPETADQDSAVESEVAFLRLGELGIACIPGELYPELVYGKFQEPADNGVDFPAAPLEPTIAELLPGKWLLAGLANDELGYIIPKRQWDKSPPYAYGKDGGQYGEVNSCGPEVAPILMQALKLAVKEAR
jgi:hypothetical protein